MKSSSSRVSAPVCAVCASVQQEVRAVCAAERACRPAPLILSEKVSSSRDEALIEMQIQHLLTAT